LVPEDFAAAEVVRVGCFLGRSSETVVDYQKVYF
jgi:hypothetical protein